MTSNKENKKPMVRSTAAQIKYLVRYMAQNPQFAAGEYRGPLGSAGLEAEWARLQRELAELGPDRTIQQWKHCWRDQKKKARAEGGAMKKKREQTGNNTIVPELSENSEIVLGTIGHAMASGLGPAESPIGPASVQIEWLSTPSAPSTTTQPTEELLPDIIHEQQDCPPCSFSAPLPMASPASERLQNITPLQPGPSTPVTTAQPTSERLCNRINIGARKRRARENPPDRFLNAQHKNNELLKILVEKVEEIKNIKKEELELRREELEIKRQKLDFLKRQ